MTARLRYRSAFGVCFGEGIAIEGATGASPVDARFTALAYEQSRWVHPVDAPGPPRQELGPGAATGDAE
jgi:hypothetical protein